MYIYKAVDGNGDIIYIGKTINIKNRMSQHRLGSKWWKFADEIFVAKCSNKTIMDMYEIYYINKYSPSYNIKDNRMDDVSGVNLTDLDFNIKYSEYIKKIKSLEVKINKKPVFNKVIKKESNNKIQNLEYTNKIDEFINNVSKYETKVNIVSIDKLNISILDTDGSLDVKKGRGFLLNVCIDEHTYVSIVSEIVKTGSLVEIHINLTYLRDVGGNLAYNYFIDSFYKVFNIKL